MEGIALTESLQDRGKKVRERVVGRGVGGKLLHGVHHLDDGGRLSELGIQDTHTINILNGKINILEHVGLLTASAESLDGGKHPKEKQDKTYYDR